MDRQRAVTALLVVLGLALFAGPLVAPAREPPDRVQYEVQPTDGPEPAWETLEYGALPDASRDAFDAARSSADGSHNVSVPPGDPLPPLADADRTVVPYDVRHDGEWYLLEVSRFDPEIPGSAHLVRLGSLLAGALLVVAAAARAVTR